MEKPNCYNCVHRLTVAGSAHSRCNNHQAIVGGNPHGIKNGWFMWPLNFDPAWLVSCDGYSSDKNDKMPLNKLDPLTELLALLR
jgi:hypothetical protein